MCSSGWMDCLEGGWSYEESTRRFGILCGVRGSAGKIWKKENMKEEKQACVCRIGCEFLKPVIENCPMNDNQQGGLKCISLPLTLYISFPDWHLCIHEFLYFSSFYLQIYKTLNQVHLTVFVSIFRSHEASYKASADFVTSACGTFLIG